MATTVSTLELEDQLALRIDQKFKEQLDDVITKMQEMAKQFNIQQIKERSPLKNVVAVSTEPTSSLEVIKNYIRYQAGRKESTNKIWQLSKTENGKKQIFADAVVAQVNNLAENCKTLMDAIEAQLEEELKSQNIATSQKENLEQLQQHIDKNRQRLIQAIHLKFAQLLLGYLSREHTALIGKP